MIFELHHAREKRGTCPMPSPHEVEMFCCRLVANGNATQAYVEAMPRAATWKRRSASRKAVDLMKLQAKDRYVSPVRMHEGHTEGLHCLVLKPAKVKFRTTNSHGAAS